MQEKKVHHLIVGDIATNCWIYPLETTGPASECVVIDPGEEGSRIIHFLDQLKLFPRYIILSHGHFDHTNAVPALAREYRGRPGAAVMEIAIHPADAEYLGPDAYAAHCLSCKAAMGDTSYIDTSWEDMPPADRLLEEGSAIGPFTVLHLPGHTPGSIGLWDKSTGVLFSGDTLFSGNYGRTDLPGGDETQLFTSLKRLSAMDADIQVFPGHGPAAPLSKAMRFLT